MTIAIFSSVILWKNLRECSKKFGKWSSFSLGSGLFSAGKEKKIILLESLIDWETAHTQRWNDPKGTENYPKQKAFLQNHPKQATKFINDTETTQKILSCTKFHKV